MRSTRKGYILSRAARKIGRRRPGSTAYLCLSLILQAFLTRLLYKFITSTVSEEDGDVSLLQKSPTDVATLMAPYSYLRIIDKNIAFSEYPNATGLLEGDLLMFKYFIQDYKTFHKAHRHDPERRLIYNPVGAGLGDMFDGMLFAYWAAVVTDRILLIDWNVPAPLAEFLTVSDPALDVFYDKSKDGLRSETGTFEQLKLSSEVLTSDIDELSRYGKVFDGDIQTVWLKSTRKPGDLSNDISVVGKMPAMTIKEIHNVRNSENFKRAVLHHFFRLNKGYNRKKMEMLSRFGLNYRPERRALRDTNELYSRQGILAIPSFDRKEYIAVHARIGKGVGEHNERFSQISEHMVSAAMCLASRAVKLSFLSGSTPLPIFLATDTREFKNIFKKAVSVLSTGRCNVLTGQWEAVHIDVLRRQLRDNLNLERVDGISAMTNIYADLLMMGHAKHIVALYSSFARLAAFLGDAETLTEMRNEVCLRPSVDGRGSHI